MARTTVISATRATLIVMENGVTLLIGTKAVNLRF